MQKIKNINTWRIKQEFLKDGIPEILLKAINNNLVGFSNFNQAIGAICEGCSSNHVEVLFQTYVTLGIFLAENKMVDINFKIKKEEAKPQSYLG